MVLIEEFRPYAAPSNVVAVLNRIRSRNLPETVNSEFLRIVGVPQTVFSRIIQALRFFELIDEDGKPTDQLKMLGAATDAEYREILANTIKKSYSAEFKVIDPAEDPQSRIVDAFRRYQPRSQTDRMAILFLGLCREAKIPVISPQKEQRTGDQKQKSAKNARKQEANRILGQEELVGYKPETDKVSGSLLFGVTVEDIGVLNDKEFTEVWNALGKVARARARGRSDVKNNGI